MELCGSNAEGFSQTSLTSAAFVGFCWVVFLADGCCCCFWWFVGFFGGGWGVVWFVFVVVICFGVLFSVGFFWVFF